MLGGTAPPPAGGSPRPREEVSATDGKNAELELQITRKEFVGWLLIREIISKTNGEKKHFVEELFFIQSKT